MTFLTGQFSIDLNRLRNRDEFAIESFVAKYEPFIRRSIRFRLARSSLGAAADSVDVYWFQFEVATQTLSLESD